MTMQHDKSHYRNLPTKNGFQWGGYMPEMDLHFFVSGDYQTGFKELRCTETDIADGNYLYMMEHNLTR